MNLLQLIGGLGALLKPFESVFSFVGKEVTDWVERRDVIQKATLDTQLAEIVAKKELAAYRIASEVEWDLAWAGQAGSSWKDEYILILWSIPAIVMFPCLMIPGLRDYALETLTFLQQLNPDIIIWYMSGWGIIFAATFGIKAAAQTMIGDRVSKVASAFSLLPDDIPKTAVEAAQRIVTGQPIPHITK